MTTLRVHPSLKRRIEQQFNPDFASGTLIALDNAAAGSSCASKYLNWPAPPKEFLSFHNASLMHYLWSRLLGVTQTPVEALQLTMSWRAVQVTGCAVFVQAPNLQIQVMLWGRIGRTENRLFQVSSDVVMLTETPYRMLWLQRLEELSVVDIYQFYQHQDLRLTSDTAESYAKWMFGQFARVLHKHADLRRMRQRCAEALNLQAELVHAAHHLSLISKAEGKATIADYNLAVQHAPVIARLRQDAPTLLRLFGALCGQRDFPAQGEPLARIGQQLHNLQLSRYVWHLALKKGARLLLPMREFYSGSTVESVRDYLCVLERLRVKPGDAPAALRLLFSEFGHGNSRRTTYWPKLEMHQAAFAHFLSVIRQMHPDQRPTEEQMALCVRWIVSNNIVGWNRAQRQRGWLWLLASAQAWQALELCQQQANPLVWTVPFDTLVWADLTFKTLNHVADLLLEGHQMRNCAATYTEACQSGDVLMVAVAMRSGKRVATASYRQSGGVWRLSSAKGPANRALKPGVERLIDQFAGRIPKAGVVAPTPLYAAESNNDDKNCYATQEEFMGVPYTSAPDYVGTYTHPLLICPQMGLVVK